MDFHTRNYRYVMKSCLLVTTWSFLALLPGSRGQVDVSVSPLKGEYKVHQQAVISCTYNIQTAGTTFLAMEWSLQDPIANYDAGTTLVTYPDSTRQPPDYTMSVANIDVGSNFTISNSTRRDRGDYTCEVRVFVTGTGLQTFQGVNKLNITKPVGKDDVHSAAPAELNVVEGENTFISVTAQNIFPKPTFSWKIKNDVLNERTEHVQAMDDFYNSTSTATLRPILEYNNQQLICNISNDADNPPVTLVVTVIKVTDPCDSNPCENGGTCNTDKGQTNCTCPEGYTGSTCTDEASTTPASTTEYGITSDLGSDTTKEVSTTEASTTVVSTSTDPPTPGSTTWMLSGGTDQFSTKPTMPLVTTGTGPGTSGPTPILTSTPTPILTTDDVDRGGSSDGLTTGQIVGICVGAGALVAILLVLTLCIFCRESLSQQCSCLQCKSSVNPEKEGGTPDKEALELNGGSTSNKEKEEG